MIKCCNHNVNSIAITNDCRYIVCGSEDYTVKIMDFTGFPEQVETLKYHSGAVLDTIVTSNGLFIISCVTDNTVIIFSLEKKTHEKFLITHNKCYITNLCLSIEDRYLVYASSDHSMKVFDIIERREKVLFQGHTDFIECFGLTSDNTQIITCSGDSTIRIWNLREKRQECVLYYNRQKMQCYMLIWNCYNMESSRQNIYKFMGW